MGRNGGKAWRVARGSRTASSPPAFPAGHPSPLEPHDAVGVIHRGPSSAGAVTAGSTPISFRKIVVIWLIAATIAVLQSATQLVHLRGDPHNWGLVALTFLGWMVWAALTPPIIRLTRRFPLQRPSLARATAVHFFAALVCVAVVGIL